MNEQESKPVVPKAEQVLRYAVSLSTDRKQNISVNRACLVEMLDELNAVRRTMYMINIEFAKVLLAHRVMADALSEFSRTFSQTAPPTGRGTEKKTDEQSDRLAFRNPFPITD